LTRRKIESLVSTLLLATSESKGLETLCLPQKDLQFKIGYMWTI